MQLWYGHKGPSRDWADFIRDLPASAIGKLTRSSTRLLAWWARPEARAELARTLDLPQPDEWEAHFEYSFKAHCNACKEPGRGKPSCTDLLLLARHRALAFEAKFRERSYGTVGAWLNGGRGTVNRRRVLEHCLHTVSAYTGRRVDVPAVLGLEYQMVHRTASACSLGARYPEVDVVYLLFHEGQAGTGQCRARIARAAEVLDPVRRISFVVLPVRVEQGAQHGALGCLAPGACLGATRSALARGSDLFDFKLETPDAVSGPRR